MLQHLHGLGDGIYADGYYNTTGRVMGKSPFLWHGYAENHLSCPLVMTYSLD